MKRNRSHTAKADRRSISSGRQGLYLLGLVVQVLGGLGFLFGFVSFALGGLSAVQSRGVEGNPFAWWFVCLASMVLMVVGGGIRSVAARGVAGSGLVLDPERARRDLEPWARMGGGLLNDALEATELGDTRSPASAGTAGADGPVAVGPTVKVRCRRCKSLSPEDSKFCSQCGSEL